MSCNGDNRSTVTYGTFTSGKGIYALVKFDSISGAFSNQYKRLKFDDVTIKSVSGDIVAPQFELLDGKLHMGDLYYVSEMEHAPRSACFPDGSGGPEAHCLSGPPFSCVGTCVIIRTQFHRNCLWGRVRFPTGGTVREPSGMNW